jgi:hypothetical protein
MPNLTKTIYGDGTVIFYDSTINYATVGTAEVIFEGYAINQGSVEATDFARFTDYTQNYNTVECPIVEMLQYASNRGQLNALSRALFSDYAENTLEGIVTTPVAVFDGYVVVDGTVTAAVITVSGNATVEGEVIASVSIEFLDSASNTASITGNAVFRGNASNNGGSVVGNLSLFGNATNSGSVQGDIELNDNASNSGSSSGNVITYTSISLNGTNYLYSGVLSSGVTIIVDANKTAVPNISGTDTIDGQSSNWSTNGSGALTYSPYNPVSSDSVVIGGTTYYYTSGATWDDGTTVLYSDSGLQNVASAAVGIDQNASPIQRWIINGSGQYSSMSVYEFNVGGTYYYFDTDIQTSTPTIVFDNNGDWVSTLKCVIQISNSFYLIDVVSGSVSRTEVFAWFTIGGISYFTDASNNLYTSSGDIYTGNAGPEILGNYRVSIASGVPNSIQVYQVTSEDSGTYYVDSVSSPTTIYNSSAAVPTSLAKVISYNGDLYYTSTDGSGSSFTRTAVYKGTASYYSAGTFGPITVYVHSSDFTSSGSMYLADGSAISIAMTGVFNYENSSTYALFSIVGGPLSFGNTVYKYDTVDNLASYLFADIAAVYENVYDIYGQSYSGVAIVNTGSGYVRVNVSGAIQGASTVYANLLETVSTTYYTTSVSVSNGDYVYNADGSVAGNLSLGYGGGSLTTDSYGVITLSQ